PLVPMGGCRAASVARKLESERMVLNVKNTPNVESRGALSKRILFALERTKERFGGKRNRQWRKGCRCLMVRTSRAQSSKMTTRLVQSKKTANPVLQNEPGRLEDNRKWPTPIEKNRIVWLTGN